MEGGAGGETDAMPEADALEFTPTWIVAGVCSLIVLISLAAERCLHYIGKTLKRKNQKALFEALLKVKEELMLLGFISLLLTVSQGVIQKTCIPPSWTNYMLPCKKMDAHTVTAEVIALGGRRLLSESGPRSEHCQNKVIEPNGLPCIASSRCLQLLLAVGTKLEHVIAQLAHEVAEKHSAIEGDLVVNPSDEHFWCARPRVILYLIHFILFQNAFEIALFFWMLTTYGFNSCIMDHVPLIVPRLVIGVVIQLLCSYSTLPLYAIVTQMGTFFKKEIFDEHVQQGLVGWAQKAKRRTESTKDGAGGGTHGPSSGLEMLRRAAAAIQGSRAPPR
ncbi:hypothetical protein ACQ4PT_003814 [Festuca glaucescens]